MCCVIAPLLCRPFVSDMYEDEGEDDDVLDEEGRTRLKLKVSTYKLDLCHVLIFGHTPTGGEHHSLAVLN